MKTLTKPTSATETTSPAPSADRSQVTRDRISGRAYEIYQDRREHGAPGDEVSDWTQAERDLAAATGESKGAKLVESKSQTRGVALLRSES